MPVTAGELELLKKISDMKEAITRACFEAEYNHSADGIMDHEIRGIVEGLYLYIDHDLMTQLRAENGYDEETGEYVDDESNI